jgi:hypothetical protein
MKTESDFDKALDALAEVVAQLIVHQQRRRHHRRSRFIRHSGSKQASQWGETAGKIFNETFDRPGAP